MNNLHKGEDFGNILRNPLTLHVSLMSVNILQKFASEDTLTKHFFHYGIMKVLSLTTFVSVMFGNIWRKSKSVDALNFPYEYKHYTKFKMCSSKTVYGNHGMIRCTPMVYYKCLSQLSFFII